MRIDGDVLVNQLVAGGGCTFVMVPIAGPVLTAVALVYVVLTSCYFARVYAAPDLTPVREARSWLLGWLGALGAWLVVLHPIGGAGAVVVSAVAATPTFLAWQFVALAVGQLRGTFSWLLHPETGPEHGGPSVEP